MSERQPILICGAGIAGLALGHGLLKQNIPFRIFERDPALNVRAQGYRVRIHGTGVESMKQILPPELFSQLVDSCAHTPPGGIIAGGSFDALTGEETVGPYGPNPPRIEDVEPLNADRKVVRSVLIQGLEDHVEFAKEFASYEITPTGVAVQFTDSTEVQGALLVAADGGRSRIRKQFAPDFNVLDTEGRLIYGKTPWTPEFTRRFHENGLRGLTLLNEKPHDLPISVLLEPMRFKDNKYRRGLPADYIYWLLVWRRDAFDLDDTALLNLSAPEAAALSQKLTTHWHPSFQPLFAMQDTNQTSILRVISSSPDIPMWEPSSKVTLMGDAAHVMSPSAGHGATTALRDAATLSKILSEDGISVESIEKYEKSMREYAGERIRRSKVGGSWSFGMRPFEDLKPVEGMSQHEIRRN